MIAGERYAPFYYKDSPLRDVLPIDVVADRPPRTRSTWNGWKATNRS